MRPHRTVLSLLAALLAVLLAAALAPGSALATGGYGELTRFGERAEQGKAPLGFLAGAPKQIGAEGQLNYAIGVDPSEGNSVFVLDEPLLATVTETKVKEEEKFETVERHYRIQKFDAATGKETASVSFSVKSPEQEEEEEPPFEHERVSNIAVDSAHGELFVLAEEPRKYDDKLDAEAGVAYKLFAFKTEDLAPAAETNSEGVLDEPSSLEATSEKKAAALLDPRGIAVDPVTNELVILGSEDFKGEEVDKPKEDNHTALETVSSTGAVGARYVDSTGFFKTEGEGVPLGVVVTAGGKVLVRDEGIAEVPSNFSSTSPPVQRQGGIPAEPNAKSVLQEATKESESGGQITVSPEEKEKGFPARLYEGGAVIEYKDHKKVEESAAVTAREAESGAVIGWTGGESSLVKEDDECVLDPGTENEALDLAAGSEGKLFVLAPEYLVAPSESFRPHTSKAVIELGPGGSGCPAARGSAAVVDVNGLALSEGEPVLANESLGLSTEVLGADAIGQEWTIENKKTHAVILKGLDTPLEFQKEETTNYELLQQPLFQYSFSEPGEYVITGKIDSDDLASGAVETPPRTLVVDAKPAVTEQPVTQTDEVGGIATFSAEASGAPTPKVQWEFSTDNGEHWTELSGKTARVLTLTGLSAAQDGEYRARFYNEVGKQDYHEFTKAATLTVSSSSSPAEVVEQPKSQTVVEGEAATFSTAGSGVPAPSIQWERSTDGGKEWSRLSGQTSGQLTIEHAELAESGYEYRATIENTSAEKTTDAATLTVTPIPYVPPEVKVDPKSVGVEEGQNASFTAQGAGTPTPTEQWEVSTTDGGSWSHVSGATSETLTFTGVTLSQNGSEYRACFKSTEPSGSKETHTACSTGATLTVKEKAKSQTTPNEKEQIEARERAEREAKAQAERELKEKQERELKEKQEKELKERKPTATIASTSSPTVSSSGALTLKLGCPTVGTQCADTVTIRTLTGYAVGKPKKGKKPKKEILTLALVHTSLSGGQSSSLTLHLSAEGKTLLAHSHTLKVKVVVQVTGAAGPLEEVLTLHLAQPKKKKK